MVCKLEAFLTISKIFNGLQWHPVYYFLHGYFVSWYHGRAKKSIYGDRNIARSLYNTAILKKCFEIQSIWSGKLRGRTKNKNHAGFWLKMTPEWRTGPIKIYRP